MTESFRAFRRVDGEPIDDYAWVTSDYWFDNLDTDDPYEVEEVTMTVTPVRTFWVGLHDFEPTDDDPDECDRCGGERDGMYHTGLGVS